MTRPYSILAFLAVVGAILFYVFRPQESPQSSGGSDQAAQSSPELAESSALTPPEASSQQAVPVPDHLRTPHAIAPDPLQLNFGAPPFKRMADGRIHKTDVIASANDLNKTIHEPENDLQILESVIASYRTIFRQNPIAGENREVVEALTGKNLHKLVFINPAHPAIVNGEFVDRWGTPYRFHPLAATHMEISSAGPDHQFGTPDDVELDDPVEIGDRGTGP